MSPPTYNSSLRERIEVRLQRTARDAPLGSRLLEVGGLKQMKEPPAVQECMSTSHAGVEVRRSWVVVLRELLV